MTTDNIDNTNEHLLGDRLGTKSIDIQAGRRAFVRSLGLGIAGAALLGKTPSFAAAPAPAAITDADILNFALNLEYLEAEFYLQAVTGHGLGEADIDGQMGPPGRVIGGHRVHFNSRNVENFATEIAHDEQAHVRFLRSALADSAVARPEIDLRRSFTTAARAAKVVGPTGTFDAFENDDSFLLAAFIFEDVGVTAYKGAAPMIQDKGYLAAAAGILAVEAYHAGLIRSVLYGRGNYKNAQKISDVRDAVDNTGDKDQGIGNNRFANIVPSDDNGLAYPRTPRQVLNIVYLAPDANRGGFFPHGLNGKIHR